MNLFLNFQQFNWIILFSLIQYTDNYKIAEEKANLAKLTSDLSTNESSQKNDKNKPKLKRKLSLDKQTKDIANFWSPDSGDVYDK